MQEAWVMGFECYSCNTALGQAKKAEPSHGGRIYASGRVGVGSGSACATGSHWAQLKQWKTKIMGDHRLGKGDETPIQ